MTSSELNHLQSLLPLACALADVARQRTVPLFRTPLEVIAKLDDSPVTVADRSAEASMRELLAARVPDHGILGEEHGRERMDAEWLWVLDPIDGTKSFITGSPLWGTLIALLHHGQPVLGVLDMPVLDERWLAVRTQATLCNEQPVLGVLDMPVLDERWLAVRTQATQCNEQAVRVSDCENLTQARVYTTSPDAFKALEWAAFDALSRVCVLRRFGGDCYSYAQLAGGYIDLVVEAGLQPYDYLAMVTLVQQAGGIISDWDGQPLGISSDGRVLAAATPALHAQALVHLRGAGSA